MEKFIYKPYMLLQIAFEFLEANYEYQSFISEHEEKRTNDRFGYLILNKEQEINYFSKAEASNRTWKALANSCQMVNANPNIVLATAKAMNRYEKKEHWQICAKLPTGFSLGCRGSGEVRTRRFFSKPSLEAQYFQSTGRRKPWAEELPSD